MDCEDTVAAVDADDKVAVYRNWLGLMNGTLTADFDKGGKTLTARAQPRPRLHRRRTAAADAARPQPAAGPQCRPPHDHRRGARATASEMPEGILDAVVTGLHRACTTSRANRRRSNSRTGSVYIVKPKMHGPEEVAFADELFDRVEDAARPAAQHLKIGIMDEERRTTVNLKACIRRARRPDRLHQHRLPRPHRRRDPHLDGSRPDDPQGRHEGASPGSRPTRTGTSTSGLPAACRARRRSARACGRCPTRWPTC